MEQLVIKNFLGKNLKASAFDIEHHQCQEISDFEISKIIGSLVRSLGYEIATDILGSNYIDANKKTGTATMTIGNIFEWRTGRASPNDKLYIAFDSANNKIYYWNNSETTWVQLDDSETFAYDKARFFERDNVLIISSGIGATNYPIHIKYYDARTIFGAASTNQAAGYYDYRNRLTFDYNFAFTVTAATGTSYLNFYYGSLKYDDAQIGDISNALISTSCGDGWTSIKVTISITNGDVINRRATHLDLYRAQQTDDENPVSWNQSYLLASMPFDNEETELPIYSNERGVCDTAAKTLTTSYRYVYAADDIFNGAYVKIYDNSDPSTTYFKKITDFVNSGSDMTFTLEDVTDLSNGVTYIFEITSKWFIDGTDYVCYIMDYSFVALSTSVLSYTNRSGQNVGKYNYKFSLYHDKRCFYAPLYNVTDSIEHKNYVGVSNINGNGDYEPDVIRHLINMQDYGVEEITGLGKILNFIIIATYRDLFKINTSSGNVFTWELNETLEDAGCIAPDSWTYIWGQEFKYNGYFYRSSDGYRVYDGYKSQLISMQIEEEGYQPFNVTAPTEAIGAYNSKTKQWIISYPTDSIVHKLDLLTGEWLESSYADEFDEFCGTKDGYLLGTDGDKIVVMTNDGTSDLTDHDGTSISPSWKSKVYDCEKPGIGKIAKFIILKYKSNTAIQIRWYLNRSSTAKVLNNTDVFAAQSTLQTKTIGLPTSQRFDEIEFQIDLKTANKASNTILQIDELRMLYEVDALRK